MESNKHPCFLKKGRGFPLKKRFLCFLIFIALGLGLCACSPAEQPPTDDPGNFYDPSFYISFPDTENITVAADQSTLTVTLSNGSETEITTDSQFILATGTETYGSGSVESTTLPARSAKKITFALSALSLPAGSYTLTLGYSWQDNTSTYKGQAILTFTKEETPSPPTEDPSPAPQQDIKTTPIKDLNEAEQQALADYLFEHYIPGNFGVYTSPKDLSSASVWASVEALNRIVSGDTSEDSRTLSAVLEKVSTYYPEAPFDPTQVRLYDASTQTFAASPFQKRTFTYLSHQVTGNTITLYYQSVPEHEGEEAGQFATTLKNSTVKGYFSFVSTLRVDAVG